MMSTKQRQAQDGAKLKRAMDKSEKDREKDKEAKKPEDVDPEKFRAAVASVVLQELEMWPEEIQALIGEDHPSEEAFMKGVPWVIGAYMHIAKNNLERKVNEEIKKAGVETAKKMGPAVGKAQTLRKDWNTSLGARITDLKEAEKEELEVAIEAIKLKYSARLKEIESEALPSDLAQTETDLKELEASYEGEVEAIRSTADISFDTIRYIEDNAGNWNSKGRKAQRKAHQKAKLDARIAAKEAAEKEGADENPTERV